MKNNIPSFEEKPKILVIDDEQDSLVTFRDSFDDDFTIVTSDSGPKALERLTEDPDFAVIIADQRMPGMSGTELLHRVKNSCPTVVRVLITGYADIAAAIDAINLGTIYKYISKPYKPVETKKIIQEAVALHQQLEEDFKLKNRTLHLIQEKTARTMENYTAWMAHHINNAMQTIQTYVEFSLPRFNKDESEKELGKLTLYYVQRIADIMKHLRYIYAYGLEHFVLCPLSTLLEFENEQIKQDIREKKIVVKKEVKDGALQMMADPMAIQEAVRKLVANAVEASPEGATIKVVAAKHESDGYEAVMVMVKDHGMGIDPEIKEKIFFPFLKKGDIEKHRGLGLPYVQAVVARHGGDVHIDSAPGKGTTVSFSIPIIQRKQEETELDQQARKILKRDLKRDLE